MGSFDDVVEGGGQESEGEEAFDVLADSYYMD
jgi:hypothetical protein